MKFRNLKGVFLAISMALQIGSVPSYALTQEQSQELDSLIFRLNNLQKRNAELKSHATDLEKRLLNRWETEQGKSLWAEVEARLKLINQAYSNWSDMAQSNEVDALKKKINAHLTQNKIAEYLDLKFNFEELSTLSTTFNDNYAFLFEMQTTPGGGTSQFQPMSLNLVDITYTLVREWVAYKYNSNLSTANTDVCRPNCWN